MTRDQHQPPSHTGSSQTKKSNSRKTVQSLSQTAKFMLKSMVIPRSTNSDSTSVETAGNVGCDGSSVGITKRKKHRFRKTGLIINYGSKSETLTLPQNRSDSKIHPDDFLTQHHPELVQRSLRHFSSSSLAKNFCHTETDRVVYASQREAAHATKNQAEWLVTHKATTCHVLSLRSYVDSESWSSTKGDDSTPLPLGTLAHVDAPKYETCLKGFFEHHIAYYHREMRTHQLPKICMDICVAGGFDDPKGKSRPLSSWLLHQLADLADEYKHMFSITLSHCLLSASNTDSAKSNGGPLVRGLGLNTKTGQVVRVDYVAPSLIGPAPILRQARLWAGPSMRSTPVGCDRLDPTQILSILHDEINHDTASPHVLKVIPFWFELDEDLHWILEFETNQEMIQYTSTSPDHEENVDDFCNTVRSTLKYMGTASPTTIFGASLARPLYFERIAQSNEWNLVQKKRAENDP